MQQKLRIYLFIGLILTGVSLASSQNVRSVDVNSVSQSEIRKAREAMENAGLSVEDAAELARQKGATEQQISDFQQRLMNENNRRAGDTIIKDPVSEAALANRPLPEDAYSTRETGFQVSNPVFGAYLFNNRNLTFSPDVNVQTPKNYEIGIGDQIIINIWGNSQNNYQLTVNKSGQIIIPDVGPVYVAGLTVDDAGRKIRERLTSIYSDLGGNQPKTFAQINIGQLRSIRVNIVGEAATPGTYTLPATATVFNALYLSGGPNAVGSFRNISIIRDNKVFKQVDIYKFLVNADPSDNIQLKNEDIVFIPTAGKLVEVRGEFRRTGIFELREGEMLDDLVRFAGGFTSEALMANTQVFRKTQQGFSLLDISFDALASTPLVDGDVIQNDKISDRFENRVSIAGAVYHPGAYEWAPGMTLYDLITKAGNILPEAFLNRGIITRNNPDMSTSVISFNVDEILNRKQTIPLKPEDMVLIKTHFELKEQPYFQVFGEVLNPGSYQWSENLTLGDALFLAGGLTEGADSAFIEIARRLSYREASMLSDTLGHIFVVNIARSLNAGTNDADFRIQPFDRISVRQAPNFRQGKTVQITGEVVFAGNYAINNKKQRISDLIKMAGGLTPQAYIDGATLTRNSEELGQERVAINLGEILKNPGGTADLYLNNGDRINIPEFQQTVKIEGFVQNPFSVTYVDGKNAKYYIERTGGFTSDAFKRKTYVRYPNGTTAVTRSFIVKSYPSVKPGSQIIVPQKPEKKAGDPGKWIAIASGFASIAVSIATLVNITK